MHYVFTQLWRKHNVFFPTKLYSYQATGYSVFHKPVFSPTFLSFILTSPYYRPLSLLPFIPRNKHSPSSALRHTLTIVNCTVYPQGDQCCADLYLHLSSSTYHYLLHVLHRSLPSHLALSLNSHLLPPTLLHLLLPYFLPYLPLHVNTTILLSQQTSIGIFHNIPALAVCIAPSSSPRFVLELCLLSVFVPTIFALFSLAITCLP